MCCYRRPQKPFTNELRHRYIVSVGQFVMVTTLMLCNMMQTFFLVMLLEKVLCKEHILIYDVQIVSTYTRKVFIALFK